MAQISRMKKAKLRLQHIWLLTVLLILVLFFMFHSFLANNFKSFQQNLSPTVTIDNTFMVRAEDALDYPEYVYTRQCQKSGVTIAAIQNCYPGAPLQKPWIESSKENIVKFCDREFHHLMDHQLSINWNALQTCWSGRRNLHKSIATNQFQIHVIGERNSGTKWLQQEIAKCFPKDTVGVRCHRDFLRSKHFFQPPVRGNYETNIVIAIVRDPLEWLSAMHDKPYHMPYHMVGFDTSNKKMPAIPLDWNTFLSRAAPWSIPGNSPHDRAVMRYHASPSEVHCVQGFAFDEVTPCIFDNSTIPKSKWRGHMPIYELQRDHSGNPFADLMKLRADKIHNFFLEIPLLMQLGGYAAVRYEDLLRNGTQLFLQDLANMMGLEQLPRACRPQPPNLERIGHRRRVPAEVKQWLEEHLVLETEQLLGYR